MNAPETIRVLLVDDHAVVRRGLRAFLALVPDVEIVGEAVDGEQALAAVAAVAPDVVIMDLLMPVLDGVAATARIRAEHPDVAVVVLTSFIDDDHVSAAIEAGAAGFLLKDAEADDVVDAIRAAHSGEVRLHPAAARVLARQAVARRAPPPPDDALTDREREVLGLIAHGLANQAIADRLGITERTARTHVSNILGKLGLSSRTQAALFAVEHHIVMPE